MKKIVIYFMALLLMSNLAFAQSGGYLPIQPRVTKYEKLQVYQFATGIKTNFIQLSKNYNDSIVELVIRKLQQAQVDNDIDIDIEWILQHVTYEYRVLNNFRNSRRKGDRIYWYNDTHYEGLVAVFSYQGCVVPIFKVTCMNLLDLALENSNKGNFDNQNQNENNQVTRRDPRESLAKTVIPERLPYPGGYILDDASGRWDKADFGIGRVLNECPEEHRYKVVYEEPRSICGCQIDPPRKLQYSGNSMFSH